MSFGLLAGCSSSTLYTLEFDVLSYMDEDREGTIPVGDAHLPSEDGISSDEFGLGPDFMASLERFEIDFAGTLTLDVGTTEDATLALHVSAGRDSDPFLAPPVAEISVDLVAGEPVPVVFAAQISESENADVLATLRSGDFSLGVSMAASAPGAVDYVVERLDLTVSVRPGALLPF